MSGPLTPRFDPATLPPITGAELRCRAEALGLGAEALAVYLEVAHTSVNRWFNEQRPVPDGIAGEMSQLERLTASYVQTLVEDYRDAPVIFTYRTDSALRRREQELPPLSAAWHRAAVTRALAELGPTRVVYA